MNCRSKAWMLDWAVPIAFGLALCLKAPLGTALEFGGDEGYELMKALLVSQGHPLYREVWNDQPPLHTELVALLFRMFGPLAFVGRLLTVGFAMALVAALYGLVSQKSGRVAGLVAVGLLVSSSFFLQLSVSVMIELPALALALAAEWAVSKYFTGKEGLHGVRVAEQDAGEPATPHLVSLLVGWGEPASCRVKGRVWNSWWLVLSGALFGCALQTKLTAVIFLPALTCGYLARRIGWKKEVSGLADPAPRFEAHRGGNTSPLSMIQKARRAIPSPIACGALRNRCSTSEAAIWCGAVFSAFGLIAVNSYGGDALTVFWASHFSAGTLKAVAPEGYGFRLEGLMDDLALLVPAAAGGVLMCWRRRWELLFPVVLLATALVIHLWHRPYWYYYGLHFAIPLSWLGAVGIVEWFRAIWEQDFATSLAARVRAGIGWLGWSAVVSLVLTLAPEKAWNEFTTLSAASPAMEDQSVIGLRKHTGQTHWVFTDRVIYAFWAGLSVPPELAVIPSKRIWSGQINEKDIVQWLERYRPEQILLQSDWVERFGLSDYMREHYCLDESGSAGGLYLRK